MHSGKASNVICNKERASKKNTRVEAAVRSKNKDVKTNGNKQNQK